MSDYLEPEDLDAIEKARILQNIKEAPLTAETRETLIARLSTGTASTMKPEPISGPLSLWRIESGMEYWLDRYREAIEDGDVERIELSEREIANYKTAELQKVDNYAGLIQHADRMEEMLRTEIERLQMSLAVWQRLGIGIRNIASAIMKAMGKRSLTGRFSGLRLQRNGGIATLVVDDQSNLSDRFLVATVTMPMEVLDGLRRAWPTIDIRTREITANNAAIRAALEAGETVPGARLERGEHVRVS